MKMVTLKASDCKEVGLLQISRDIEAVRTNKTLDSMRNIYTEEAKKIADFLCGHMPQGLVDHLMAELMHRKASLFVITGKNH